MKDALFLVGGGMNFQYLLSVLLLSVLGAGTQPKDVAIMRFGVYVVVSDLDRARTFYEQLFQKKPYVQNEQLVGFDVAGGLFAAFSEKTETRRTVRGDNIVPYIRVRDVAGEFERVRQLGVRLIDPSIVQDGPLRLFRFADPDGNVIEYFSVVAQ